MIKSYLMMIPLTASFAFIIHAGHNGIEPHDWCALAIAYILTPLVMRSIGAQV